ncbi:hypothetical protein OAE14_01745 [Alphaproteobacteria bacterium]|nr:hypothetical protein [Alphaproteobacteria bacterium]
MNFNIRLYYFFFVLIKIIVIKINAKKNLELLICKGFKEAPNVSVPKVLASIVVAAISKEANII